MEIKWIMNNTKPPKNSFFPMSTRPVLIKLKDGSIPQYFFQFKENFIYDPEFDLWTGKWISGTRDNPRTEFWDDEVVAWAIIE